MNFIHIYCQLDEFPSNNFKLVSYHCLVYDEFQFLFFFSAGVPLKREFDQTAQDAALAQCLNNCHVNGKTADKIWPCITTCLKDHTNDVDIP